MASENAVSIPKLSSDERDDLIYFARSGDIQELHSNIKALSESKNLSADAIINSAIDIDQEDPESSSGCSLLHWAAANNHEDILNFLLTRIGALPDVSSETGTANGAATISPSPSGPFKARNGGLVNHRNRSGNTPLHWAALNGNLECVKFLVRAGADPSIRNLAGHDAVFEAERGDLNKNGPPPDVPAHETQEGDRGQEQAATRPVGVAEWLLENCEDLDKGIGGDRVGESSIAVPSNGEIQVDG